LIFVSNTRVETKLVCLLLTIDNVPNLSKLAKSLMFGNLRFFLVYWFELIKAVSHQCNLLFESSSIHAVFVCMFVCLLTTIYNIYSCPMLKVQYKNTYQIQITGYEFKNSYFNNAVRVCASINDRYNLCSQVWTRFYK